MARHTIIIDTDPGIDDAMAVFYALASADIEVLGLTTVFGNVGTKLATDNALRLLDIAGASTIPVARGAARPLAAEYRGAVEFVHGGNGQGGVPLDPPVARESSARATQFIIDTVTARPGEVTLVTLGPLTNLALVLLERPEIVRDVRGVIAMGGNVHVPGNASAAAEANILNDPEAADIVLSADWPVTICGLDVTHRITMSPDDLQRLYRIDSPVGRHLAKIVPFYHAFYETSVGSDGIYVHDSTTISYLLHSEAFSVQRWPLVVDISDGFGRGKTWPIISGDEAGRSKLAQRPTVTVCVDADARRLVEAEIAALERMSFGTDRSR
ncbi:MAG TPA: nucleoside hydrolase [Alkalispirochaeta sp.]|nr:nucleoside hydrolase [Alkalispirochaeta sp.]